MAILLPEGVRQRIHEATADLRGRVRGVAWVPPENLHVTLRFLGAVEPDRLERVAAELERAGVACDPFRIAVAGLGAFPYPEAPRILWVGVTEGRIPMMALQGRIETAVVAAGVAPEERASHPHVTLGRVRDQGRGPDVSREASGPWGSLGWFQVAAFHLMRSELGSGPARYRVLVEYQLPGPGVPV